MNPQLPQNWTPETEIRVGEVAECLLSQWRRIDIVKKFSVEWNVSFRAVDEYIAMAKQDIRTYIPLPTEELIQERISEYRKLHRLSLSAEQYGVARTILKDISELQGLLVQKIDVTSGGKPFDKMIIEIVNKSIENSQDTGVEPSTV